MYFGVSSSGREMRHPTVDCSPDHDTGHRAEIAVDHLFLSQQRER